MGLKGGAIAGIVIGCVVFVVAKTACKHLQSFTFQRVSLQRFRAIHPARRTCPQRLSCLAGMVVFFKWWFRRRQRILATRRGRGDVEKAKPLEKLAAALHLKNKGGSSTGSSSSSGDLGHSADQL